MMKFEEPTLQKDWDGGKESNDKAGEGEERDNEAASSAALGALLDAAGVDEEPGARAARLGERLARLDALNVGGMLAAATEGGGARLAAALRDADARAGELSARHRRLEALARGAPDAGHARSGAARADANARALLHELDEIYAWLDAPPLRDLADPPEMCLTRAEGRARALATCGAVRAALRAEESMPPARRRLGAVRERLRRLARARDHLAAALARHVNNLLIHLGNEAAAGAAAGAGTGAGATRHHAELLPLAPLMRCLKQMDEKAFAALGKVYASTWSRVHERTVRAACEPARADDALDAVLALVETLCNAEQDFCSQFFHLDADLKSDSSDGERSEKSESGRGARAGPESRRYMAALFPGLEPALLALTHTIEKNDQYGAFRVLACVGRRVLGAEGDAAEGEARWARAALAGVAVHAKRQADRTVADRVAQLDEVAKQAQRRPKCGLLPFLQHFEELSATCEKIFAGGRRADLERWYCMLASAMVASIARATHPRTPRAALLLENYHALGGALAALRVPALEPARRECRARYADALKAYVTHHFPRPLEKLALFFEGVAEAVANGVREEEVCYRAAFSKHELRRVLAMYPAHEVRKSLHRLYRTVEKHLSEESGLLQVVWRAMQEEFIAQHRALQARIAACYPAAGLTLPLTTQHILDAFSDIARDH